MKRVKIYTKFYFTLFFVLLSCVSRAQVNQEIIVTGRGATCKDAENDAYEKGLSQGGGAFYADNKEMINRQIVNESLEVLKTGNVLKAETITPCKKGIDNNFEIVMKVTVSQTELKKFVDSKGKAVGYSGEEMVRKKKMEEQAELNELLLIQNVIRQMQNLASDPFDYFWEPGQPKFLPNSIVELPGKVIIEYNQNYHNIGIKLIGELKDVALKPADIQFRKDFLNKDLIVIFINEKPYYLRNTKTKVEILTFYESLNNKSSDFIIVDGSTKRMNLSNTQEKIIKVPEQGKLIFPNAGQQMREINGKIIVSESEAEKLNRINIFSKSREQQLNKNTSSKNDLALYYYSETNPLEFNKIKSRLEESIENIVNERPEGKLNFEYKIQFTQTGKNKSEFLFKDGFGSVFQFKLEDAVAKANLNPSMIGDKYTKSKDSIVVNLNWKSQKENITYTAKQGDLKNNFISLNLPWGIYQTELKQKELNGLSFYDQKILKYNTRGPVTAFNSILLPGWGTRKVTYNERNGWGRFTLVVAPILAAITSEMLSKSNYNNYRQTNVLIEGNMADVYYNKANNLRRASLVFASVGLTAYIFDISWVINKGLMNKKNKNKINELIRQDEGLYLRKQTLKL